VALAFARAAGPALFERHIIVHVFATLTVTADFTFMNEAEFRRHLETIGPIVKAMRLHYDVETERKPSFAMLN